MLILTRRISESLIIGDKTIVVTVLGIKGNQVRIGIDAPTDTLVDREEVYLRKQREKELEPVSRMHIATGVSRKEILATPRNMLKRILPQR